MAARVLRDGALLVLIVLCGWGPSGCRINPVTREKELIAVSSEQELSMGDRYHPNLVCMYDGEYRETELKQYLGTIVKRLHAVSHRQDMRVDFTVLNTSIYNAFAIPGHVYCTRGFLDELETEAQFAAVMGHELGHVAALHTAKQMTNQMLTSLGLALAGSAMGDSESAQGLLTVGQMGVALLGLSYSREQERQADRLGTYYMAKAGWDPRQAIVMQKIMDSLNQNKPGLLDRYLSTHPQSENRMSEIRAVIRDKSLLDRGLIQGDGVYAGRWERYLAHLKKVDDAFEPYDRGTKLLADGKHREALDAAEEAIERRSDQAQFFRLKGDALLGLRQHDAAEQAYRKSLELYPRYVLANMGLGRVALHGENYPEAERQFETVVHGFPAGLNGHYGLGVARFQQGKYREAIEPLKTVTSSAPREPEPHYLLAVCYEKTGQEQKALLEYRRAVEAGLSGEGRGKARERIDVLEKSLQPTNDSAAEQAG